MYLTSQVSTHSRPKAAGGAPQDLDSKLTVSTHSRPKAAGGNLRFDVVPAEVSTHSRPKAAGPYPLRRRHRQTSFNTQPPEGGWVADVGAFDGFV